MKQKEADVTGGMRKTEKNAKKEKKGKKGKKVILTTLAKPLKRDSCTSKRKLRDLESLVWFGVNDVE